MKHTPLDVRLTRYLLKGEEDILSPRAKARTAAVEFNPCPKCGSDMQEVLTTVEVFTEGEVLPRTVGKCSFCDYTYDPHSGLILNTGDARKRMEDPYRVDPADD